MFMPNKGKEFGKINMRIAEDEYYVSELN